MFGSYRAGVTPAALKAGMASAFGLNLTDLEVQLLFDRFDTDRARCTIRLLLHVQCRVY